MPRSGGPGDDPEAKSPKQAPSKTEKQKVPLSPSQVSPTPVPPPASLSVNDLMAFVRVTNRMTAPTWTNFQPRFDILPPAQQDVWPELREASRMGFVLYGGTAIALRLGHRQSVDFDFFTENAFNHQRLAQGLPFLAQAMVIQEDRDTLTFSVDPASSDPSPVKLSFFKVGTGRIGKPEWTSDGVALVASMQDLMAHKLKVMLQRLEKKDYLDVHALVTHGHSLEEGLAGARAIYGRAFQPAEALKALTYFKGGDLHELPLDVQKELIRAVAKVDHLPPVPEVTRDLGGGAE